MLDSKGTFDDLVASATRRHPSRPRASWPTGSTGTSPARCRGPRSTWPWRSSTSCSEDGRFDLVVVDTPPTRNALDFLDAPRRLTRFLENRLFRLLLMPTRAYLRAVSVATQALLRTISKVAGAEIVHDAVAFFQAFEGMEEGFRTRAEHVRRLLADRTTAFVLVTSPRSDAVDEAGWFADKLNESGLAVEGLVVNRVHPAFGAAEPLPTAPPGSALAALDRQPPGLPGREPTRGGRLRRPRRPGGAVPGVAASRSSTWTCTTSHGLGLVADHVFSERHGRHPLA